jgi:hypothetical protein
MMGQRPGHCNCVAVIRGREALAGGLWVVLMADFEDTAVVL